MKSPVRFPSNRLSSPFGAADLKPILVHDAVTGRRKDVTYLNSYAEETKYTVLQRLMSRLGSGRFAPEVSETPAIRKHDPFMLVLLADQELAEGREEQASSLIEAAYDAYDHQREPHRLRIVHDNTAPDLRA
jgi:hypothetical protein